MDGSIVDNRARWTLGIVFTSFLTLNVVMLTMALLAFLRGNMSMLPPHLGEDVSMGIRFGLVLIGLAASWFFARMLYKLLVKEDVPPTDAVSPSYSLLSYLVLVIAAYAFLGVGTWLWLPVLFLIVLVWSVLNLWALVGWVPMLCGLLLAAAVGVLTIWIV